MKKILTLAFLTATLGTSAFATDTSVAAPSQPAILLTPYGTWEMCAVNPAMSTSMFCAGMPVYVKGQEPDLLLVTAVNADTVAFAYSITGTDINGVVKTWTGTFLRNDVPPRVTASYTLVNAGILKNATITIQELSSTLSRVQEQNTGGF